MNYYIEDNNEIKIWASTKKQIQDTITLMPQYAEFEIKQTQKEIIEYNGEFVFKSDVTEELFLDAKAAKHEENSLKANEKLLTGKFYIEVDGKEVSYYYDDNTKNDLNASAIGFIAGVITEKQWTDEEGNTVLLTQENVAEMLLTLNGWGNPIWQLWGEYFKQIEACQTIAQLDNIVIDYNV